MMFFLDPFEWIHNKNPHLDSIAIFGANVHLITEKSFTSSLRSGSFSVKKKTSFDSDSESIHYNRFHCDLILN